MAFHTSIRKWGNSLLYIGYDDKGNRITKKIPFKPTLWTTPNNQSPSNFTDMFGASLSEIKFEDIKSCQEFINNFKDVNNFTLYGTDSYVQLYIAEAYKKDIEYDFNSIRKFFIDIENLSDNGTFVKPQQASAPITVITLYDSKVERYKTFSNTETSNSKFLNNHSDVDYFQFDNEEDMLMSFISYWSNNYPDIVTGWNTRGYDIIYLVNRIKIVLGEETSKILSPWKAILTKQSNIKRFGIISKETIYDIVGINELDYMDLYKKYNLSPQESYALDFVCEQELKENKISYSGSLDALYREDLQKYIDYNIHDVRLVVNLDKKKQFLNLIVDMSYFGKVSCFNDTLGTVKFWEHLIYNHLYKKQIQPEIKQRSLGDGESYAGGFVKEPIQGLYDWIVSIDATSLYPSIIRQVNIGADTHIGRDKIDPCLKRYRSNIDKSDYLKLKKVDTKLLKLYNCGLACNNELYDNSKQSFLSELMEELFNNRKKYKKMMLDCKKQSQKIQEEIDRRND